MPSPIETPDTLRLHTRPHGAHADTGIGTINLEAVSRIDPTWAERTDVAHTA